MGIYVSRSSLAVMVLISIAGAAPRDDPAQAKARLEESESHVAAIDAAYEAVEADLRALLHAHVALDRQLVLPGEPVTLTVEARSATMPNQELIVYENCFSSARVTHTFSLTWKRDQDGVFRARWEWTPPSTGNYIAQWTCDVGGDVPVFTRNFSVIDGDWAVVVINSNANGANPPEKFFHEMGIPSNLFSGLPLFTNFTSAESLAAVSRDSRRYGDGYTVCLWQSNTYIRGDEQDKNARCMYDEPPAVRDAVLNGYRRLMELCGFDSSRDQIMVGPMSNDIMHAIDAAGYKNIIGLYADQNWDDAGGHVQINHWGMPSRPYFMSTEDFRKPGEGNRHAALGVQQCHRHTVLCRDYNCVFSLEPGADYMMDRYQQIHRPRTITPVTWSREADFFEALLRNAPLSNAPLFFTCCFEFAGFDWMPELHLVQEQMATWLQEKLATTRLAPATPWGVGEFYRSHYAETPESVVYLPDVWAGRVHTGYDRPRPSAHPDTLELENGVFKAIFRAGDLLPYAYYDYTTKWGFPHRDLSGAPRNAGGYVIPNTIDRFRIEPPILDTRMFDAVSTITEKQDATRIDITITARQSKKNLALALWNLPREFTASADDVTISGLGRFIPVRAPYTENFCAIVVTEVHEGINTLSIELRSHRRPPKSIDLQLSSTILAKVFERDGQATSYVYNIGDSTDSFTLVVPDHQAVKLHPYASISDDPVDVVRTTSITVEPTQPVKITGLTLAAWQDACPHASQVFLTVDSPLVTLPGRRDQSDE